VSEKKKAQIHCANWDCGKCLGVLFIRGVDSGQIYQRTSKEYYKKDCFVEEKGCQYFKKIVRPVLT
jgi:hypothetical protein